MNLLPNAAKRRAGAFLRICVGVVVLAFVVPLTWAGEVRYPTKWDWSPLQENEIKALAAKSRKAGDGFWEIHRNGILVRTDVSRPLAAEASHYAAQAIKVFPQVIKLPSSSTRVKIARFTITIHRTEETYDIAAPDREPDEGFAKVRAQEEGGSVVEVHLRSAWDLHPGFNNNLVECIDVGVLQGHLARVFLQLWRPDEPLPPFLAFGYESYFESFNVYKKRTEAEGMTRASFRNAFHEAILQDKIFRPSLSAMLHLSEEDFEKDPNLNGALSNRFAHFVMEKSARQKTVHQLLAQSAGDSNGKIDFKAAAALENGWHRSLYRLLANSRLVLHSDLTAEGRLPGAASVSNLSAYGNKPLLSLLPAKGGAYDIASYNSAAESIHIMRCDAEGRKIAEFSPSFISKARALLGATRLPGEKGYVVGYATDNVHGNKGAQYWVAGFDPDGNALFNTRIFGDRNLAEVKSKGGPGGAGSARIVYNEKTGTIGYYLSHNMLWADGVRHQGGFIGFLNEKGNPLPGGNGWFYSHNFDQRLIVANGEFCALAHGDAYPRALGFSRWSGSGGKRLANKPYHSIPGESGANTTNCQTGGLVALPNRRYAVVFASSNNREAHDICIKILDESGKSTGEKWLTTYPKGAYGAYPRIARDGDDIFLAWHEFGGESGRPGIQKMVLNVSLETIVPRAGIEGAQLSPYDDLHNLDNGAIVWAVPVGGNKIRVYRIDQPAVLEQKLIAHNVRVKRVPKSGAVARVDRGMTIKLAELGVDKKLPRLPVQLSVAKKPMRLVKVDKAGLLHFVIEGEGDLQPAAYGDLPLRDRAVLALALSEREPENRFLYGIAGFYLECSGTGEAAAFYFGKAGPLAADQFAEYFGQ